MSNLPPTVRDTAQPTALVTGASGLIGQELVSALVRAGHPVLVVTRNRATYASVFPVRVIEWSELETLTGELAQALARVAWVFHLAGENVASGRWNEARKRAIAESRIEPLRALARALKQAQARPECLISASAIGIYGDGGEVVLTESARAGSGFLAQVCLDWEDAVMRAAETLGAREARARFGVVLKERSGAIAKLEPLFRIGAGGPVGSGEQWLSWIHVADAAGALLFAARNAQVRGAFNAVAPTPVRNREFARVMGQVLGRPTVLPAPEFAIRLAFGEMAQVVLASARVIPERLAQWGFAYQFGELGAALGDLFPDGAALLRSETWIPAPVERVWEFFSAAANLETITPPWLSFRVTGQSTQAIASGTRIDYRLKIRGVPSGWQTEIQDWVERERFVDTQARGPYALWHHTHSFAPLTIGGRVGTYMTDRVRYRLPMGVLGEAVAGWLVHRDVEKIFGFRARKIRELWPWT